MEQQKKKRKAAFLLIGFLALFMGFALAALIGAAGGGSQGGLVPYASVEGLESELKAAKAEKEVIYQELRQLEEKMAALEADRISDDSFLQSLSADLEKYKLYAGMLDVQGPGLLITVDDPVATEDSPGDGYSVIMVRYDLLLNLVNKLKEAGAEAISINGQRLIASTEITLAGSNVNINGKPTAPPYTIAVIGDPDVMESAISIRYGVVDTMRTTYSLQVSIAKQEEVRINRYSGVITFRYATPLETEENS